MTAGGALPKRRLRTKVRVEPCSAAKAAVGVIHSPSLPSAAGAGFLVKERHPGLYVIVQNVLDAEMLERLEKFLRRKRPQPAKMKNEGGNSDDERKARYEDRDSRVSQFNAQTEIPWLHNRFAEVTKRVANKEWPLFKVGADGQLQCEYEETQYAVYGPKQHFKAWHQDAYAEGHDPEDARQIAIVAMLTSRSAYTAGHFQAELPQPDGKKAVRNLALDAGDCVIFPAKKLMHRVSPVKTGVRKTIVFWVNDRMSCKYYQARQGEGEEQSLS